jgi:myo-inositol-1(or 4)-monophosphatase
MIDILLRFAHKAGKYLLTQKSIAKTLGQKDCTVESIVTEADVTVSNMFATFIKKNFSKLNYIIIDEEKISHLGHSVFDKIAQTDYQFVIDPIDGTVQFATGHALYGITIGVYKKGKPLIGLIYLPEIKELVYCDEKYAYSTFSKTVDVGKQSFSFDASAENIEYGEIAKVDISNLCQ